MGDLRQRLTGGRHVPRFLAELYVPAAQAEAVDGYARRARVAARELTGGGLPVRYLHAIFVPADETCFHLYEAISADAVREVASRAGLTLEHLAEVVEPASTRTDQTD